MSRTSLAPLLLSFSLFACDKADMRTMLGVGAPAVSASAGADVAPGRVAASRDGSAASVSPGRITATSAGTAVVVDREPDQPGRITATSAGTAVVVDREPASPARPASPPQRSAGGATVTTPGVRVQANAAGGGTVAVPGGPAITY